MPSGRIIFPESGRSLDHVTTTIFGSTVGYPSDSLASCYTENTVIIIIITFDVFTMNYEPVIMPFFYRAMHFSANWIACRLSVCLSVCDVGEL